MPSRCGSARRARASRTILQMVQLTRLDCAIASAGLMRMALAQAIHHARHRIGVPEAARRPAADAGGARRHGARGRRRDRAGDAAVPRVRSAPRTIRSEAARARLLTPAVKYLVCKTRAGVRSTRRWSASAATAMSRRAPAAALSRGAGQRDLGRLGQRHVPRRAARARARAGGRARCSRRSPTKRRPAGAREAVPLSSRRRWRGPAPARRRARAAVERLAVLAAAAALRASAPARDRRNVRPHPARGSRAAPPSERAISRRRDAAAAPAAGAAGHEVAPSAMPAAGRARPAGCRRRRADRSPRRACARLASAAMQLALDRGGREPLVPEPDRQLGTACARLRAKARVDCARGPSLPSMLMGRPSTKPTALRSRGERDEARGIGGESRARDRLDPGGEPPVGIAGGDPDGLGAEIEPDERAARRQQRGDLDERQNRQRTWPRPNTAGRRGAKRNALIRLLPSPAHTGDPVIAGNSIGHGLILNNPHRGCWVPRLRGA